MPPERPAKPPQGPGKATPKGNPPRTEAPDLVRLNKRIAESGLCARRKADELITEGRVRVNGHIVTVLGTKVHPKRDQITVDYTPLPANDAFTVAFHKPTGIVTSRKAGPKQKSLYSILPPEFQSGDPAGRLDQDSSGLLILSSDGDFLQRITHPRFHVAKVYEVTTDKPLNRVDQGRLIKGVILEPEEKLARMASIEPVKGTTARYRITLMTGLNRQIRRSMAVLGYRVNTLVRVSFGPVKLGGLQPGEWRALSPAELKSLQGNAVAKPTYPTRKTASGAKPAATKPEQGKHRPQNQDRKPQESAQQNTEGQAGKQGHRKGPQTGAKTRSPSGGKRLRTR